MLNEIAQKTILDESIYNTDVTASHVFHHYCLIVL